MSNEPVPHSFREKNQFRYWLGWVMKNDTFKFFEKKNRCKESSSEDTEFEEPDQSRMAGLHL
jgi:hypothetical protein